MKMIGQLFSGNVIVKLDPISTTLPIKIQASPTMKFPRSGFLTSQPAIDSNLRIFQESLKGKTTRMIDGGSIR